MLTTPPATAWLSGLARGRHPVSLAVAAVAAAGLLAGCASASTNQAGATPNTPAAGAATTGSTTQAPGETEALYVNHAFDACSSASAPLLTVMPVRSGQAVQGTTP